MEKRFLALLVMASGSAVASPSGDWLALDYGTAADESGVLSPGPEDDGTSARFTGRAASPNGAFIRFDARRHTLAFATPETTYTAPSGTTFDVPAFSSEDRRDLLSLSIGRSVPVGGSMMLTGEIGYSRVEYRVESRLYIHDAGSDSFEARVQPFEADERGWLARLAIGSFAGPFTWRVEGEYLDAAPAPRIPPLPSPFHADSAFWWNARFGYDIAPAWNVGIRYADNDELSATTLSLRWSP